MPHTDPRLSCEALSIAVAGRQLVTHLQLDLHAGSFVCVLGTNGAGKTLTLHTLAGLRAPASGQVMLNHKRLAELSRKAIARQLGLLLQIHDDAFPMTVMDTILMGRYPHAELWQWTDKQERTAVRATLATLDLGDIENRIVTSLSGGERERVALATILVQDPKVMLLDEPTNHLDPHHQLLVLDTLHAAARKQRIVLTTIHNPALAMRYADFVLLLYGDGEWEYGPAEELLEPVRLERMYQTPFSYFHDAAGRNSVLLPV